MKLTLNFLFLLLFFWSFEGNSQIKKEMIPLKDIQEMYNNMEASGVKLDSDFLYTYFFISEEKANLEKLKVELEKQNFQKITIEKREQNEYWLDASRVERHNAKSLFEIGKTFYKIADKYNVDYDGFDLGNSDGKSGIERDTYIVPEDFKMDNLEKNNLPELVIVNSAFVFFPHKEEFKYILEFSVPYKFTEKSKLPSNKDLKNLDNLEFAIEEILTKNNVKNYYVFRTTTNEERKFYIAVSDKNTATKILEKFPQKEKFILKVIEDEKWEIYYDTMKRMPK